MEKLITARELATILGCTYQNVYLWIKNGNAPIEPASREPKLLWDIDDVLKFMESSNKSDETDLYRHFDDKENLLYVGISLSAVFRLSQHKHNSKHYSKIAKITIEKFETRDAALAAERKAIETENPKYNVVLAPNREFRRPVKRNHKSSQTFDVNNGTLTVTDLAKRLNISRRTLYNMIDDGRFPVDPIPNTSPRRWSVTDVNSWAAGQHE